MPSDKNHAQTQRDVQSSFAVKSFHLRSRIAHRAELRYIPGMPNPPSMPPTVDCICASTLRAASLIAASTRSCSISTSPDLTASGSMRRLSNCLRPSILTVTVPPPDVASTTVSCIFFCRASYCDFAFDISSCRLNPPIKNVLPLISVIDHGANLGAELLPHAADNRILLRARPPTHARETLR